MCILLQYTKVNINDIVVADNNYRTWSYSLKNCPIVKKKLKVEKEAQSLFGDMREATIAEQ